MKQLLFKLLCNNLTGTFINTIFSSKIPDVRWPSFRFRVNSHYVQARHIASIFWGFYESAEIRFVERYIDGKNHILELGGSIGIVSAHLCSKLDNNCKLVTVEPNPNLIDLIVTNGKRHMSKGGQFIVLNKALSYSLNHVSLQLTNNNTETKILPAENVSHGHSIESTTISELILSNEIDHYDLICDIEGSEIEFILNEKEALKKCKKIIIELHHTTFNGKEFSIDYMIDLIQRQYGFVLKDSHGPVFYFSRH